VAAGAAAIQELPRALPPEWEPAVASRPWTHLVLHHTATDTGSVASIDAVHRTRTDRLGKPWLGIGYHFVIGNGRGMPDGQIEPTFRWAQQLQGAHAGDANLNASAIGICLVGDFNQAPPTGRQIDSARRLVEALRIRYGIGLARVVAHRQVKATDCPGKLFPWQQIVGAAPTADDTQAGSRLGSTVTFSRYD